MTETASPAGGGFRSGFALIVGAPNTGKSTLLNRVLGEKISITSKKAQTTRNRVLGVLHRPGFQIVFLDTPGVHRAEKELNVRMVDVALRAMSDADVILFMLDLTRPDPESEALVAERLALQRKPVVLALNKTDAAGPDAILPVIDRWRSARDFAAVVPVSAKNGFQVDVLVAEMAALLPEGPPYFPEDAITDMSERFIVAEMVREKVIRLTGAEIPYATAVTVDHFDESDREMIRIDAAIHVERDSQKGIVIGKGGRKLREIGEAARKDIERMLGTRVFLKLFVRVQKNWSRDTRALRRFGYE